MVRRRLPMVAVFLGLALLAVALTAGRTGLDPENNWGPARRQVFGAGVTALGAGAILWLEPAISRAIFAGLACLAGLSRRLALHPWLAPVWRFWTRAADGLHTSLTRMANGLRRLAGKTWPVRWAAAEPGRHAHLAAWLVFCLAIPAAVWLVSVGFWTEWPPAGSYYDDLAQAFRSGQLHLIETPDPRLVALPDPYEFEQRRRIPTPWDVVLYEGKFYLYWGPLPAILVATLRSLGVGAVGDNSLVFVFVLGAVLFTSLVLARLWNARYRGLSAWALFPALLVAAFAHPLPFLLTRPAVYEASIAAGQSLLMAGLFFAAPTLLGVRLRTWELALSGVCWAGAIVSRMTLLPAVICWLCLLAVSAYRTSASVPRAHRLIAVTAAVLPVVIGCVAHGWYNSARFGSPFEFGHRYQLTGMNLHQDYAQVFALSNVPVNVYNYFLRGVRTLSVFPYVKPDWGTVALPLLTWLELRIPFATNLNPRLYYAEQVTGLIFSLPFAAFALVALLRAFKPSGHSGRVQLAREKPGTPAPRTRSVALALVGGTAAAFAPTLLFVVATTRYLADSTPSLVILAAFGAWDWLMHRRQLERRLAWPLAAIWALALASVAVSLLLAVTGYDMRFERLNPDLFDRIVRFFAL